MAALLRAGVPVRRHLPVLVIAVLLSTLPACGSSKPPGPIVVTGTAEGMPWSVTVADPPEDLDAEGVRAVIDEVLARVDAQIWTDDSEIARFNRAKPAVWTPVSAGLAELVGRALTIGRETVGAFDVTRLPLLRLWGVAGNEKPEAPPSAEQIRLARERGGLGLIEVRQKPPALRKKQPGLTLYLAEIAPGYAMEQITRRLDALGAERYRIELGDAVYARGKGPGGRTWRTGLEWSQGGDRPVRIELNGTGMVSAGGDSHFIVLGRRRFPPVIDPRTGRPVAHDLRSVTVVADEPVRAGALARALLVMGKQAGIAYANAHGIAAQFVSREAGPDTRAYSKAFEALTASRETPE